MSAILLLLSGASLCFAQQPAAEPKPAQPPAAPAPAQPEPASPYNDGQVSVGLFYWMGPNRTHVRTGALATGNSDLNLPRKSVQVPGVVLTLPAGTHHALRFSYFRANRTVNTNAPAELSIFGVGYRPGDYLAVGYKLENAKISLDYLSWPFPVADRKFRVKTLWEAQYVSVKSTFNAPLNPLEDEEGTAQAWDTKGTNWFLYPSLGMGAQYVANRNFRWEAKGSGFVWPGRPALWDAETFVAIRGGRIELNVGAKAFHFRTSTKQELFWRGTLMGGFVGLRWYPKL
ncbi:MAG: hypothetical protein ACE15B_24540 [Bryobacteraceae bacterium]